MENLFKLSKIDIINIFLAFEFVIELSDVKLEPEEKKTLFNIHQQCDMSQRMFLSQKFPLCFELIRLEQENE